jgi:hypothetical protein
MVLANQVTTKPDRRNSNWIPLSTMTQLVTVTAGGDDLGWPSVFKMCFKTFTGCENDKYQGFQTLNAWFSAQLKPLELNLAKLYDGIAKLAPNAQVLVLGYPQLLPADSTDQDCPELSHPLGPTFPNVGLDNDEQNWIRSADDQLNATIASAVSEAGGHVVFLPVAPTFAGHEICTSDSWMNGIDLTTSLHSWFIAGSSFHPTQCGQNEYASIVEQYLGTPVEDCASDS